MSERVHKAVSILLDGKDVEMSAHQCIGYTTDYGGEIVVAQCSNRSPRSDTVLVVGCRCISLIFRRFLSFDGTAVFLSFFVYF